MTVTRSLRALVAILAGALMLTGCGFDVYSIPLPGGTDVGDKPMTVSAEFRDVLDLVPQSAVKVNDVTVGKVTKVERDGYLADVTMSIRNDTDLPSNVVANIRQTSLLGEKFVSLDAPATGASGQLADHAVIPVTRTGRNPEVEEVLGALSLILNGGGIGRLKIVTSELNNALGGREDAARSVLTQVQQLMTQLDGRKTQIVNAITSVNRLAVVAHRHMSSIDQALAKLPSALDSLNRQRGDLKRVLLALAKLGNVGVRVIKQVKGATLDSLESLAPVLTDIGNAKQNLVKSFSTIVTYPFIDEAVGSDPQVARNLHMGDYVNLSMNVDLDLQTLALPDIACLALDQLPSNESLNQLLNLPNLCDAAQSVLSQCNLSHPQICAKIPQDVLKNLCQTDGGTIPSTLCSILGQKSGQAATDAIQNLLKGLGLGRPAPGFDAQERRDEARWHRFDQTYDSDLLGIMGAPLSVDGGVS